MKKIIFKTPEQLRDIQESMWSLFSKHINIEKEEWCELFEKTQLYALFYHSGELVGFAGIQERVIQLSNRKVWTVALNQAAIIPKYRNNYFLQHI